MKTTKLPTEATSYYTVHKAGRYFDVVMVTPCPPAKAFKTSLCRFADRSAALARGKEIADRMHRPFRAKGAETR